MGVYCYTLRKNPIKAFDMDTGAFIEIGTFMYAYKESWNDSPEYKRKVARAHAFAEKARDANPNLVIVTIGNPAENDFDKYAMTVYRCSPNLESFMDTNIPGESIGYLRKVGRKFLFERV